MSTKSDRDNHANQLNPNNDEYGNSRGWSRDNDDFECAEPPSVLASHTPYRPTHREVSLGLRVAIVGLSGRSRLIAFRTIFTDFLPSSPASQSRNEDFGDLLLNEIARQIELNWRERLATYCLYDEQGEQIVVRSLYEFPATLYKEESPERNQWRESGKSAVALANKTLAQGEALDLSELEDWGTIPHKSQWTSLSRSLHNLVTDLLKRFPDPSGITSRAPQIETEL